MSKFIDKLNNLNKASVHPMGFNTAGAEAKPACMLIMVELSGKTEEEISDLVRAGITAGLINGSGMTAAALSKLVKNNNGLPAGIVLGNGKSSGQKAFNGDVDFIVFDASLPLAVFEGKNYENVGKVVHLEMSADAGLLRSVNNLYPGVDAVLADMTAVPLTVEHMMACRRLADFSGQPVIARTNNALSAVELAALREAGVKCLLLNASASLEQVKQLVETIKSLPKPDRKKERHGVALVPSISMAFGAKKEEDGEDDDGDDD